MFIATSAAQSHGVDSAMDVSRLSKTKKIVGPLAAALFTIGIVSFVLLAVIFRGQSMDRRFGFPVLVFMFCVGLGVVLLEYSSTLGYIIRIELSRQRARSYPGPFFVLLRSFENRDMYQRRPAMLLHHHPGEIHIPITSKFPTIDNISAKLEISLRGRGMLVALGGKFELSPDSEMVILQSNDDLWRQDIGLLAAHSKAILLLPETTKGVIEEMKVLLGKGLTEKTIVIMPPLYDYDILETGQEAHRWDTLQKELIEHGFFLPRATASGMAFIPQADLSVKKSIPLTVKQVNALFRGGDDYGLPEAMAGLIPHLKGQWTPLKDVCPLLKTSISPGSYSVRDVLAEADEIIAFAFVGTLMACIGGVLVILG